MTTKEFAIWGIPPNSKDEVLLREYLKSKDEAIDIMQTLVSEYRIKSARIQEIDFNQCPSILFKNKSNIN
tara:strand:- start:286 stop:495 length:210 start_codon:yes stop_codon:yes gene_type:complete